MKIKITIILIIIIAYCSFSNAQYAKHPEYAIGIRGGTSWSMMWFTPSVKQPTIPMTFHAGTQFRFISEKYFGLKIEINYAQRGFKDKDGHRRFDYIELPLMTHITFGQKLFRFFIDLGPEVSYLLKDNPINVNSIQHSYSIKNKFDYSILGGLGFEFNTKYGIYTIDARYRFGLNNVFGNSATEHFRSSTNQNITLSLAYLFPIRN